MRNLLALLLILVTADASAIEVTLEQQKNTFTVWLPEAEPGHKYNGAWLTTNGTVYDAVDWPSKTSCRFVVEDWGASALLEVAVCGPEACTLEEVELALEQPGTPFTLAVGLALVAGFLMNLMPCVLPVIGLKLRAFADPSKKWPYVAGVMASFGVLATCSIILGTGISLMGFGIYRSTLAAICLLMACQLLGVWKLPSFGYSGTLGPFGTGILTVALGSSCAVPFLAPAMAYTIACTPLETYLIFMALGVGFCSPFLLPIPFSHFQNDIWMFWFEKACAGALIGVSIWIASTLPAPILSATMLLTGLTLLALISKSNPEFWGRSYGVIRNVTVVVAVAIAVNGQNLTVVEEHDWPTDGPRALFFTADWCMNCIPMKAMLDDSDVLDALSDAGIDSFTVIDFTNRPPDAENLLASYGVKGDVPVIVVVRADGIMTILTGIWTKPALLEALGQSP